MNDYTNTILIYNTYNGFKYICAKSWHGAYLAYVDIENFQFLGIDKWYDRLPFHGGCTFSGVDSHLTANKHWLIGCDWAHDYKNMYGIEHVELDVVEKNIKEVIDSIPELLILNSIENGAIYNEKSLD